MTSIEPWLYPRLCPVCVVSPPSPDGGPCESCRRDLSVAAEPWCPGCGGTNDTVVELCQECIANLRKWRHATSAFSFERLTRDLIHDFKYHGHVELADYLAGAAAAAWFERGPSPRPELVVPVPLHWLREWRRGYNQTELLARAFCRHTGLVFGKALVRRRYTRSQARLDLAARRRNLRGAFSVRLDVDLASKRVLLFDDVLTTGSTLEACTERLLAAGAQSVDVITIARG